VDTRAAKRVLVIEDEPDLARLVRLHLEDSGFDVEVSQDGNDGLARARRGNLDLVVLDLMLPGLDGLEVCRQLRSEDRYTPILMLTARSGEVDRVVGLEVGADDYLTKPFSVRELVARVRAILRRIELTAAQEGDRGPNIAVGPLRIDKTKRRAMLHGKSLSLTAKEFDLLAQLARHPGRVYSRSELLDLVWGYGHDAYEHTVNSHINRLRSKMEEDPAKPRYVLTVWGTGYRLFDPDEDEA
jgi:DNA-binding response OmpR family regulator